MAETKSSVIQIPGLGFQAILLYLKTICCLHLLGLLEFEFRKSAGPWEGGLHSDITAPVPDAELQCLRLLPLLILTLSSCGPHTC